MNNALRKIEPMPMPVNLIKSQVSGAVPVLRWIAPTALLVDETYQRDLSRKSVRLIKQMVERFAWNRMKPPVVVEVEKGLHIVDGQHTAIAAATLGIPKIPIFLVDAPSLDERARSFVGHNTDRITVSPINIWKALLASGDPDAADVDNVCKRAGVRIRTLNQSVVPAEGDTMAIGTVQKLIKRRGVIPSRRVLQALVKARRAPISAEEIRAAEHLICDQRCDEDELAAAIRIEGDKGLMAARSRAMTERTPIWREVAARWHKRIGREVAA